MKIQTFFVPRIILSLSSVALHCGSEIAAESRKCVSVEFKAFLNLETSNLSKYSIFQTSFSCEGSGNNQLIALLNFLYLDFGLFCSTTKFKEHSKEICQTTMPFSLANLFFVHINFYLFHLLFHCPQLHYIFFLKAIVAVLLNTWLVDTPS